MNRSKVVMLAALVLLALLLLHPYILGLPGRIGELRFQREIRPGMSRTQIVKLATKFGGTGLDGSQLSTNLGNAYDWRSDGALQVQFMDFGTLCISGGKSYSFYFRPDWKLMSWESRPWENAC